MLNKPALLIILALISLFALLPFLPGLMVAHKSYGLVVDKPAPNFTLHTTDHQPLTLDDLKGQFVYLYFGYLHCNGVCQTHLATFFHLANHLEQDNVKILFITLDGERDTQSELKQKIETIHPKMTALWTDQYAQLQTLTQAYRVPFYKQPSRLIGYDINHAGFVFLIDEHGQWRRTYTGRFLDYTQLLRDLASLESNFKPKL